MTTASTSTARPMLSLADLEAFDPGAARGGTERVSRCPICQSDERAFHFNATTGAYNCKRASCAASGKLTDFWNERPKLSRQHRSRAALNSAFSLQAPKPQTEPATATNWRAPLKALVPLRDTAGAEYLAGRGIACEIAHAAGARYSPDFYGRAAVVFPIRDRASTLVAATGRYIDPRANPKARTGGHKRDGVFHAPAQVNGRAFAPLDKSVPAIIVCEAPIDALSIAAAGYPAIALCGTSAPDWLHLACGFRRVLLAFDGDAAGDKAAAALIGALDTFGASCERLRPENGKDWNEVLTRSGAAALGEYLAVRVLLDSAARTDDAADDEYSIFD